MECEWARFSRLFFISSLNGNLVTFWVNNCCHSFEYPLISGSRASKWANWHCFWPWQGLVWHHGMDHQEPMATLFSGWLIVACNNCCLYCIWFITSANKLLFAQSTTSREEIVMTTAFGLRHSTCLWSLLTLGWQLSVMMAPLELWMLWFCCWPILKVRGSDPMFNCSFNSCIVVH